MRLQLLVGVLLTGLVLAACGTTVDDDPVGDMGDADMMDDAGDGGEAGDMGDAGGMMDDSAAGMMGDDADDVMGGDAGDVHVEGDEHADDEHADGLAAPSPFPDARRIEVEAGEFFFEPATIEIAAGQPVNIEVTNTGDVFHDFTIPALDYMIDVEAGETATAGLEVSEPGTYEYLCTVGNHANAGMVGTLTVTPSEG